MIIIFILFAITLFIHIVHHHHHNNNNNRCYLGIPSHHWVLGCIPPQTEHHHHHRQQQRQQHNNHSKSSSSSIPQQYWEEQRPHQELRGMIHKLKRCLSKRKDSKCANAKEWKQNALHWLHRLVAPNNNNTVFRAVHDTPYPYFLPELLRLSNLFYNHTILLLSERDPKSFTVRRLSQSDKRADPMCIHPANKIDPSTLLGGVFDLLGCIDHALMNSTTTETDMADIFTTFDHIANITKDSKTKKPIINNEDGVDWITQEMTDYQNAVRQVSQYSFNMFVRPNRTSKEMLADEIIEAIPVLRDRQRRNLQRPAQHVHWGKNKMRGK